LLIQTIADQVHSMVEELETAGDTSSPGLIELKQFAIDLDLYESVRLTPEGDRYGRALLDRLLAICHHVDTNLHSLHSSLLVAFLEERLETMPLPAFKSTTGSD
jgi:hypothetical protein